MHFQCYIWNDILTQTLKYFTVVSCGGYFWLLMRHSWEEGTGIKEFPALD